MFTTFLVDTVLTLENKLETLYKKKKIGACVFLSTVFFLSLLAGKFATNEQMLLTEWTNKNGACVITDPVFLLSFLVGKIKMFKLPITRVEPTKKNLPNRPRNNICLGLALSLRFW